jgi:hypothetical protein
LDLTQAVEKLTRSGLEVMAGFIVGFDADDESIFERQLKFIQSAPIPLAMVGVLSALPGSQLWRRLSKEGRLLQDWSGENFGRTNFKTRMPDNVRMDGYKKLLKSLYDPEAYYARCLRVLELWPKTRPNQFTFSFWYAVRTLARALWRIGVRAPYRGAFWRFIGKVARRYPQLLDRGLAQAVIGEHVIRFTSEDVLPRMQLERQAKREESPMAVAATNSAATSLTDQRLVRLSYIPKRAPREPAQSAPLQASEHRVRGQ